MLDELQPDHQSAASRRFLEMKASLSALISQRPGRDHSIGRPVCVKPWEGIYVNSRAEDASYTPERSRMHLISQFK